MFGYIKTDYPNLYVKDTVLYRSMYCGLCKSIGKCSGACARLALNYDLTFLSVLMHNLADKDIVIEKKRCIIHWFFGHPVAKTDNLSLRIGALNVILAYYKINDDIIDSKKGKIKRRFFAKGYKKAKGYEPVLDSIVKNNYAALRDYEKSKGNSIDIAADFFGTMIKEIVRDLLADNCTADIDNVAYCLGKWIYLIDALDDFDKDKKKKNYNVFHYAFADCENKSELMQKHKEEIEFIFGSVLSELCELSGKLNYKFNHDLLDNVFYKGLYKQTVSVMEGKKCKKTTKF